MFLKKGYEKVLKSNKLNKNMILNNNKILITGVAGFIGSAVAKKLIIDGISVIGIDNINNYYDKKLKVDRLKSLKNISIKRGSNFFPKKLAC